jgi:hypothetical protein
LNQPEAHDFEQSLVATFFRWHQDAACQNVDLSLLLGKRPILDFYILSLTLANHVPKYFAIRNAASITSNCGEVVS